MALPPTSKTHPRRGFTLIEILVVIAIIVVLMGILIPAIGAAKQRGYYARTQALLTGLSNNCEAYFTNFDAYPGPIPAQDTVNTGFPTTTRDAKISGTQNLLVGLTYSMYTTGGTQPTSGSVPASGTNLIPFPGTSAVSVDMGNINGPADLSAVQSTGTAGVYRATRTYSPYYNPATSEVGVATGAGTWAFNTIYDRWPDALPIIYFRRTPGVDASLTFDSSYNMTQSTPPVVSEDATTTATYYRAENKEYFESTGLKSLSGTVYPQNLNSGFSSTNSGSLNQLNELAAAIVGRDAGITKNSRGGFVLMAAGGDRTYGPNVAKSNKNDDIIVVGGH